MSSDTACLELTSAAVVQKLSAEQLAALEQQVPRANPAASAWNAVRAHKRASQRAGAAEDRSGAVARALLPLTAHASYCLRRELS